MVTFDFEGLTPWAVEEAYKFGELLEEVGASLKRQSGNRDESSLYKLDDRIILEGLERTSRLNGSYCRVVRIPEESDDDCRYEVEVESTHERVRVKSANMCEAPEIISPSHYVILHSLTKKTHLNGTSAKVLIAPSPETLDRYHVELTAGKVISVSQSCVLACKHEESESSHQMRGRCCVCLSDDANVTAAVPCGHTNTCHRCSRTLKKYAPCPICRMPVEKFVRLFP